MITYRDIEANKAAYKMECRLHGWPCTLAGLAGYIKTSPYRGKWAI